MPRDRIAPWGAHTSPRRSGKADHGSRVAQPQGYALTGAAGRPSGGGRRQRAGWRRTAGRFRRREGQPSGVRAAHGGQKRARAGKKAAHAGASGVPGGVRGCRGSGQNRGQPGLHPGARRAKNGRRRGKTGRSGGQKGGYGGRWGQKSPFLPRNRRATGLCWGENWRRKLAGRVGLFGTFRKSSDGFGGKVGGFEKPFPRAYRKELPRAPFLCRWRTVIGADNLVVPSGCYLGRKE